MYSLIYFNLVALTQLIYLMIYNYLSFLGFVSSDQDSQGKKKCYGNYVFKISYNTVFI